jgi:uncharacterized protein (UPF0333 family)
MRLRSIVAVVLIIVVLYICISPFISSPKTALRAKQIAALLFYLLFALAEVFFAFLSPEAQPQRVKSLRKSIPSGDPLADLCLLRV